jgi:hypothetical protein
LFIFRFFRHNIEQKWGAALYRLALAHAHPDRLVPLDEGMRHKNLPDRCVEFDVNKVNTTNFPLTIRAVNDAVGLIVNGSVDDNNGGHSTEAKTIAIAVGDANTSPHFMTSSGVSTGEN